jgi:hypothetical protein
MPYLTAEARDHNGIQMQLLEPQRSLFYGPLEFDPLHKAPS